jgi:hypothetical protein
VHASSSQSKKLTDLGRTLEECQIILCLQEVDLEVQEAILAEELERGLHPTDEQDLSVELEKACARVDRINGECAIEAEQLSWWVMRISIVLVDLGMLPIQDIPQLTKSAREVLLVVELLLKRLQEALASGTNQWD